MIGLVNAAGMSDVARSSAVDQAARNVVGGIFVPIERGEGTKAFSVLRSAIEQADFRRSGEERKAPSGEESDRFAQAETEARVPTENLGQLMDVTA
ncbi:MAG: hypothetical protein GY842_16865 [bacterium]|nr:hypothetical protein [bacterium]